MERSHPGRTPDAGMRRIVVLISALFLALLPAGGGSHAQEAAAARQILYVAWFDAPPYMGRIEGSDRATGFDVALLEEVARRAGFQLVFDRLDWDYTQEQLQQGEYDIGLDAGRTTEHPSYATLSAGYRRENDVLFLTPDAHARLEADGVPDSAAGLFDAVRRQGLKVGVVSGYRYGAAAQAFLEDPGAAGLVTVSATDADNARLAGSGVLDGFVADRLGGYQALANEGFGGALEPVDVAVFDGDVHFLFSNESVTPETVARFDDALRAVREDGTYDRLEARFIEPLLLSIAVSTSWFPLLDWIGTVAFAVSGVLLARRERYSIFGALVLAALPAVGGGVVRDLLVDRRPIGILADPTGLVLTLVTVAVGFVLFRLYDLARGRFPMMIDLAWLFVRARRFIPPRSVFEISDALGLAAFIVTGVVIALRFDATPLWLWGPLLAVLTGAGGGILRDVVRSDVDIPALKTSFYAEICLVWGLFLSAAASLYGADIGTFQTAVVVTIVGAFASRVLIVVFGLRSPRF